MNQLPFTAQNILEHLVGQTLVISSNIVPQTFYEGKHKFVLNADGTTDIGLKWNIEDDALRILSDTDQLLYSFRGLEARNGNVFIVGHNHLQTTGSVGCRVILHIFEPLMASKWCIGISTHKDYYEKTVPKIWKSLLRQGVNPERIIVVADGFDSVGAIALGDIPIRFIPGNLGGFAALRQMPADVRYMLLLQDTVEIMDGFEDAVEQVDVGVNWDIKRLVPASEMGFYSADFIARFPEEDWQFLRSLPWKLETQARMWTWIAREMKNMGNKDVYGNGIRRTILQMDELKIRKFLKSAALENSNLP